MSALEAESGDRIRLDAVPDAGIPPPDLLNRRFSEIEVQPLEFNLRLSLPEPPPAPLAVGETARLLFDVSHLPPPGRDGEKPGDVLPVEITEVSGATADQKAGVTVKIGDPQHSLGLLAWRVQAQRKRGQIAFPSTIMVEFTPHYGRAEGQVLRIPAAALARRGDDAFVWREIKGFALPVWVRALGLIDGDVLVTERTGARGMPVRPDDWRRLSAYQRGETLRAALHPDDARVNHLLAKDTAIVAKPDESLSAAPPSGSAMQTFEAGTAAKTRAETLLAMGTRAIDELGKQAGEQSADALKLLDGISASTANLQQVSTALMPLMTKFRTVSGLRRLWQWFTGELLEREVFFPTVCGQIEQLAGQGESGDLELADQSRLLLEHAVAMEEHIRQLELDIEAGRLMLSPEATQRREAAGFDPHEHARLSRRLGNLEAMATALRLTQAQFKVAVEHAQAVSDRFKEVRVLLLPIWKQRMGFELFSQRVTQAAE
ncbi:hypothetical protein [Methylogaea oryzae]|nr:hypothetical protein [Methylogaea oryzae]